MNSSASATSLPYEEDEDGSTDRQGLLNFLDLLITEGVQLTEVAYIVNYWKLYGLISMKHHGFVIPCSHHGFLSLDFGRKGILWKVWDEFPGLPDDTCIAKSYQINADAETLKQYCQRTKPFDFLTNECSVWAAGLLKVLRVHDPRGRPRCHTSVDLLEAGIGRHDSMDSLEEVPNEMHKSLPVCRLPFVPPALRCCSERRASFDHDSWVEDDELIHADRDVTVRPIIDAASVGDDWRA